MEYLVGAPKPPEPKKKRWGRKQKLDKLVKREARRLVERYIRRHVPGWQTSLPLWGETGGRAARGAEHAAEEREGEGGEEGSEEEVREEA